MTLGTRVEQLRTDKGLTLSEAARRAGISSGMMCNIELDRYRHTSVYTVRKIARGLDVFIDDIMLGVDELV